MVKQIELYSHMHKVAKVKRYIDDFFNLLLHFGYQKLSINETYKNDVSRFIISLNKHISISAFQDDDVAFVPDHFVMSLVFIYFSQFLPSKSFHSIFSKQVS